MSAKVAHHDGIEQRLHGADAAAGGVPQNEGAQMADELLPVCYQLCEFRSSCQSSTQQKQMAFALKARIWGLAH